MNNTKDTTRDHAKEQARAQLDGIVELINALDNGGEIDGETLTAEQVSQRIQEDPLDVCVRTKTWHIPGQNEEPDEYRVLLCTGGPAVQITGQLGEHGFPEDARIEYQDWGTPWTEYHETTEDEDAAILAYARQFYCGE